MALARSASRVSRTSRPFMALLDLVGRRWLLRVVWELRDGPVGFRALQERCDAMSPSVLSQRLAELAEAGVVAQEEDGSYGLTRHGDELVEALAPLTEWASRWSRRQAK